MTHTRTQMLIDMPITYTQEHRNEPPPAARQPRAGAELREGEGEERRTPAPGAGARKERTANGRALTI